MTAATLLHVPDDPAGRNVFSFEHAMAHRQLLQVMGPLTQWSVLPYFVDPAIWNARPGTNWHLNHQQAHDDFNSYLLAYWGQTHPSWQGNPGIPTNKIVLDSNLEDTRSRRWWTFVNHQEHYTANQGILPLPLTASTLPWWLHPPRRVATFW